MSIKHVLVVDDSRSARMVLAKMLQSRDITADLAESADEALAYLTDHRPDAIFMDHMMRGIDGLQATRMIKDNPATATIPVAMYTSQDGEDYRNNVLAHGAVGILAKPPTPEHLEQVLNVLKTAQPAEPAPRPAAPPPVAPPVQPAPPAQTAQTAPGLSAAATEKLIEKLIAQHLPVLEQRLADTLPEQIMAGQILPLLDKRLADTRDDIIAISQTNQDIALDQGLHRLVMPRLEERIAEVRKYVASAGQSTADSVLNHKVQTQLVPLVEKKLADAAAQQQAAIERVALEVAGKLFDSNMKKLYSRLSEQMTAKFSEIDSKLAEPRKIDPDSLKELLDKANAAAARKASETAGTLAEQAAAEVAQRALGDIEEKLKAVNTRLYVLSGVAALVGVLAAVVAAAL